LPGAAWIEGSQPPVVLGLPLLPPSPELIEQEFAWTIPPGATGLQVKLVDAIEPELLVEGQRIPLDSDGRAVLCDPASVMPARQALLRLRSRQLGGGALAAPVTYTLGTGKLRTGSWLHQGLRSYSGAIRMRQSFTWNGEIPRNVVLDLGRVPGTVEASLNGKLMGQRFLSPYSFQVAELLKQGANELELVVTNTLANFLSTWSPTRGWSPDQLDAGIIGPVVIRA